MASLEGKEESASPSLPGVEVLDGSRPRETPPSEETSIDTDKLLVYGAKQIIRLFVPVSICMLMVVVIISYIKYYVRHDGYLAYTPFHSDTDDAGTILGESLANAFIFIGILVFVTILLVICYKYNCIKFIYGWLVFTSIILLFVFCLVFFETIFDAMNIFMDWITVILLTWNLGIIGMLSLFWKAPLVIQQGILLLMSSQMALLFIKYFPDWTTWCLLGLLAVWDLIAVLCPKGPLRILVEIAQERDENLMPVMIYSTTAAIMADFDRSPETGDSRERGGRNEPATAQAEEYEEEEDDEGEAGTQPESDERARRQLLNNNRGGDSDQASSSRAQDAVSALNGTNTNISRTARNLRDIQEEVFSREDRGVKLGLGDFVFYSVLVGKASKTSDWNTTLACYVAILIGMCFTLLLLAIRGHALPALPISIFFGLVFYFCTSLIISPFTNTMSANQVFV